MANFRSALGLSLAQKYSVLAVNFVSITIIARLLTPAEVGIFSTAYAFSTLLEAVRDFGISNYLIQEQELTKKRIRTAFTVTLITAWTMGAAMWLLRGEVADFYNEPGLSAVFGVLSINFMLIPFVSPAMALLRREMRFKALYWINTLSSLISSVIAVALAYMGFSYMSMTWASLATVVTTIILITLILGTAAWQRPGLFDLRRILSYSLRDGAVGLVAKTGMNAAEIILGKLLGFAAVGLYSRGHGLVQIANQNVIHALTTVLFPAFAQWQRDGEKIEHRYLLAIESLTAVIWPFYVFLGLMAYPLVRILFGDQWDGAIPVIQFLCFGQAIYGLWSLSVQVLYSMGQIKPILRSEVTLQTFRVVVIIFAAQHSLAAVAASQVLVYLLGLFVYYRYLNQFADLPLADTLRATRKSLLVTLASALAPVAVLLTMQVDADHLFMPLLVAACGSALGWFLTLFLLKHPVAGEIQRLGIKVLEKVRS